MSVYINVRPRGFPPEDSSTAFLRRMICQRGSPAVVLREASPEYISTPEDFTRGDFSRGLLPAPPASEDPPEEVLQRAPPEESSSRLFHDLSGGLVSRSSSQNDRITHNMGGVVASASPFQTDV